MTQDPTEIANLLSKLGKDSSESKPSFDNDVEEFIHNYSLQKSDCKTPNYVLWYTYKELHKGSMSKIGFFRELAKHFDKARTGKQKYYRVSGNFDVSHEGITRAKYFNKEKN